MLITQIKETCMYMNDLGLAKWFYGEIMGFQLIGEVPENHLFFKAGTSILLCFNPEVSRKKQFPPAHYGGGKQHIAFEVPLTDYYKWQEKLKKGNVEIVYEETWPNGFKSFYFNDPEGNLLEIVPVGLWDS